MTDAVVLGLGEQKRIATRREAVEEGAGRHLRADFVLQALDDFRALGAEAMVHGDRAATSAPAR